MSNQINVIHPYKWNGQWVFDDAEKGLDKEPFVAGADVVLDVLTVEMPNASQGFNLVFSNAPFPGADVEFQREEKENGGWWYSYTVPATGGVIVGWLCPAIFKYFDEAPERIYASVNLSAG